MSTAGVKIPRYRNAQIVRRYLDGWSVHRIAKQMKCGKTVIRRVLHKHCPMLLAARDKGSGKYNEIHEPTPDQIAERCAEIQARWSEAEHERRVRSDWKRVEVDMEPMKSYSNRKVSNEINAA